MKKKKKLFMRRHYVIRPTSCVFMSFMKTELESLHSDLQIYHHRQLSDKHRLQQQVYNAYPAYVLNTPIASAHIHALTSGEL